MRVIELTHWPLSYVMNGISIGALSLLIESLQSDNGDDEYAGLRNAATAMRKR